MTLGAPRPLFEKIWTAHVVHSDGDTDLLYVDRCLLDDTANHVFTRLEEAGYSVVRPRQIFAFADHYVPTARRDTPIADPEIREMVEFLDRNASAHGLDYVGIKDPNQGIMHVVAPELGLILPGITVAGSDSHTSTHGAFGSFAFGVGTSEAAHILATQTIWQRRPKTMRITIDGDLSFGVGAKDIILAIISRIGIGGATGYVIEYAGSTIEALPMDARMTVCNMSIEAGARAGMIAPDETTFAALERRAYVPAAPDWDACVASWRILKTDPDAHFDRDLFFVASTLAPMVTWGTNPGQASAITERVPSPGSGKTAEERAMISAALEYMDLAPGRRLATIPVDRVFIGSCTNARIEDLRDAARVARLGHAVVPTWVVPGSSSVRRQAEQEGLDQIFLAAGFEWRHSGCSLCTAVNGDSLRPSERCASTSNRNFQGRQGRGGRTHLLSPVMAAAAAITGKLTDVRTLDGVGQKGC